MAREIINQNSLAANDGLGDSPFVGMQKVNANFLELYTRMGTAETNITGKAPIQNPTFQGTVNGITAAMVGLGNVTNTADADKPVSTAQAAAIAAGDIERLKTSDVFEDFIASGLTIAVPSNSDTTDVLGGVAYAGGKRFVVAANMARKFTALRDTYVEVNSSGVLNYHEKANGVAPDPVPAGSLRFAKVVTNATIITSVSEICTRNSKDSIGNLSRLASSAINNTVAILPSGKYVDKHGNILTVGANARFSTFDDALAYRDTVGHTLLAGGLTGTITYVAGEDRRVIITVESLTTLGIFNTKMVGVRIGGPGNPILRCNVVGQYEIQLLAPIAQTFSGAQIDLYQIKPFGIEILPGEVIELGNSSTRIIPAFTYIYCQVRHGATIYHYGSTAGIGFSGRSDQNECGFFNLVFGDASAKINNTLWRLPAPTTANCQALTDFYLQDCLVQTANQDFIYGSAGTAPQGAMHLVNNHFSGSFDITNPILFRHLDVRGNTFSINSVGDFASGGGDGGEPTGLAIAAGWSDANIAALTYPQIVSTVRGNTFDITGIPDTAGEGAMPCGFEIRGVLPSQAAVVFDSNFVSCNKIGGADATSPAGAGFGVDLGGIFTSTKTPTIVVSNNVFDCKKTNSAAGTMYSMHSNVASYSIKRNGNRVINGTLGNNTDNTGFV